MVSVKFLGGLVAAALVTGCVAPGETYQDRLSNLRSGSLSTVSDYATSVAEFRKSDSEESAIELGKHLVADSLKDPGSAQFRNVRFVKYGPGAVICGEVNGKNSYGGYVGFKRFVAGTTGSTFVESGKYADVDAAANAGINSACR